MELSELTAQTIQIFGCQFPNELPGKIEKCVLDHDLAKFQAFKSLVGDLEIDWLQRIFQYWMADRKEKMQDFTPASLADLLGMIATTEKPSTITDMCSGSGALTIAAWKHSKNTNFECLEFDETVIPFLLFNLAVRNIKATVKHMDVLALDVICEYKVTPTDDFSEVIKIDCNN